MATGDSGNTLKFYAAKTFEEIRDPCLKDKLIFPAILGLGLRKVV